MLDIALAVKFDMSDRDIQELDLWEIKHHLMNLGKGLRLTYQQNANPIPKPQAEKIRDSMVKQYGVGIPSGVPTQQELFKKWNVKKF